MSATIKQYTIEGCEGCPTYRNEAVRGKYVLHADHLASHQYDEEKERALFEATFSYSAVAVRKKDGRYMYPSVQFEWDGWVKCAKSRAKAAECE